jgi:hypothetical protein
MKISFDFDDTLSTQRGQELAKKEIDKGNELYIISARSDKEGMLVIADKLGIPHSRVYATGSNEAKILKVRELGIERHIDNNSEVISKLPNRIGKKFNRLWNITHITRIRQKKI